jgi:hypothetical protein
MDAAEGLGGIGLINLIGPIVSAAPLPHAGSLIERLRVDLGGPLPCGSRRLNGLAESPRVRSHAWTVIDWTWWSPSMETMTGRPQSEQVVAITGARTAGVAIVSGGRNSRIPEQVWDQLRNAIASSSMNTWSCLDSECPAR